jgi:hypothetical protein
MAGQELLQWHLGKAGTVEHTHHILTNELAPRLYWGAKHAANAASLLRVC